MRIEKDKAKNIITEMVTKWAHAEGISLSDDQTEKLSEKIARWAETESMGLTGAQRKEIIDKYGRGYSGTRIGETMRIPASKVYKIFNIKNRP